MKFCGPKYTRETAPSPNSGKEQGKGGIYFDEEYDNVVRLILLKPRS